MAVTYSISYENLKICCELVNVASLQQLLYILSIDNDAKPIPLVPSNN